MATTPNTAFKLSPSHLEGLDTLAARYSLPTRSAVIRKLIEDALADATGGLPSPGQIAALMDRLTEAVRDPRYQ